MQQRINTLTQQGHIMSAITLQKGSRVSLAKADGSALTKVCIGLNWGAIETGGFLGMGKSHKAVDLDASIGVFDAAGKLTEKVYFGRLTGAGGAIKHSGDDRVGDTDGDDGLDNEVIVVDLTALPASAAQLAVVLDSYDNTKFDKIPHASIRVYEGTPTRVNNVLATYDIANDSTFTDAVSMIMGKLYNHNGAWKFNAIGESTTAKRLDETLRIFANSCI